MRSENQLEVRVRTLESRVSKLEKAIHADGSLEMAAMYDTAVSDKEIVKKGEEGEGSLSRFVDWMKEDFLMKLGAAFLILALGWFVTYAFANNWIGPMGRIALGILVGLGLLSFGYKIIPKRAIPGQVLTATGATMILLTISAARYAYDFFTPGTALVMTSLIVALTAAVSVVRRTLALSILALLGGAVAPFLIDSPDPNFMALLSYVFVLDLGVLLVSSMLGHRVLILLGLIVTGLYSTAFGFMYGDNTTIWLFMALFFGLFFASSISAIIRTQKVVKSDLFVSGFNGILLLIWISAHVPDEWKSLVLTGVTLLAVATVYALMRNKKMPHGCMYIYSAFAVVSFGAAMSFELEGSALVIAFALEALAVIYLAEFALSDRRVLNFSAALPIVPVLYAFSNNRFDSYTWKNLPVLNEHFFVLAVLAIVFFASAYLFFKKSKMDKTADAIFKADTFVGSLFGLVLIWLCAHSIFESESVARGVSLVIYSVLAVSLIYHGVAHDSRNFRIPGNIIIAGVVLRLLFAEVWLMPLSGRIVTFVLVGVLLIGTAFFQKKHKLKS